MQVPAHIRHEFESLETKDDPLQLLQSLTALREWLRSAIDRIAKQAKDAGSTYTEIGASIGRDRQNVQRSLTKGSQTKGLTTEEYDGVSSGTLRYWHRYWSEPERITAKDLGADAKAEAAKVLAELEARQAAGKLRKPIPAR